VAKSRPSCQHTTFRGFTLTGGIFCVILLFTLYVGSNRIFNDFFSNLVDTASNERLRTEWWSGKDVEGSDFCLI
jgi:hypothetical protein